MELILEVKDESRGSRHLEVIKINKVTETKHLSFIVFLFTFRADLLVFLYLFLLLIVISFIFVEGLIQVDTFLVEFTFTVN